MSQDLCFVKYIKWIMDIPDLEYGEKTESPVFYVNGNEYYFRFVFRDDGDIFIRENCYCLYILNENEHAKFQPFCGHIRVDIDSRNIQEKREFKILNQPVHAEIWSISSSKVRLGDRIIFLLTLDDNTGFTNNDKCLQTGSYLSTDVPLESVTKDFSRLLDSGPCHDAEIKCGQQSIGAHKIILSSRSDVFKAMLESDMLEGRTGIVEIQEMDPNYVQDFLKYLYTGTIPELTFEEAKVLYEAGDKYAIRSLMLRCSEYLQDNLSPENIFGCFEMADAHSDDTLKDKIKTYLLEQKIYLKRKYWQPFCENFPKIAIEVYNLSYANCIED